MEPRVKMFESRTSLLTARLSNRAQQASALTGNLLYSVSGSPVFQVASVIVKAVVLVVVISVVKSAPMMR